jgi:hypothetical protein
VEGTYHLEGRAMKKVVVINDRCQTPDCNRVLLGVMEAVRGECSSCWYKRTPPEEKRALGRLVSLAFMPATDAEKDEAVADAMRHVRADAEAMETVTLEDKTSPTANGRQPVAGDQRYTLSFLIDTGQLVKVHMGMEGVNTIADLLYRLQRDEALERVNGGAK